LRASRNRLISRPTDSLLSEEIPIRQHVAIGAEITGYAGILDNHRAQKNDQLGLLTHVLALRQQGTEAGDLALTPLSLVGSFSALDAGPTYPAREPLLRIDHVVASPDLLAWKARIVDTGVSDHRALVVELGRRHLP